MIGEARSPAARCRNHPVVARLAAACAPLGPAWLVGGAVRDAALGRLDRVTDWDVAVAGGGARPAAAVAAALGGTAFSLDAARGAWRVAAGRHTVDVVALRAPSIEADLALRDFTVNALAVPLAGPEELLDPLGGLADLAAGVLRSCSDRAVADDPLRALRAYRLAAGLGLSLSGELRGQIRAGAAGLARVAPERVSTEWFALLDRPEGAGRLRDLLADGVLETLLPFVREWRGLDQGSYHAYDLLEHSLRAAEAAGRLAAAPDGFPEPARLAAHLDEELEQGLTRRALLVCAALLHDIAKPETASWDGDRRRFIGHEARGGHLARKALEGLRAGRRARAAAQRIVAAHLRLFHLATQPSPTRRARLRYLRDLRTEAPEAVLLAVADERATGPEPPSLAAVERTAREVLALYWELADAREIPPLVRGRDLVEELGLAPGPRVGAILRALAEAEARGEVGTRADALALARRWLASGGGGPP